MGCSSSKVVGAPAASSTPPKCSVVDAGSCDSYKASRLFAPLNVDKSRAVAAILLVHGNCLESMEDKEEGWMYMYTMAEYLTANLGVVSMIIGMHDDDTQKLDEKYPGWQEREGLNDAAKAASGLLTNGRNAWPAAYYGDSIAVAIENLVPAAMQKLGVSVDSTRIALVGHSMGGGGVLYAAAVQCKSNIKAVAALNPSHMATLTPFDGFDECVQYAKGKAHSGENGEGVLSHLANITVPCYVYGSRAEYNTSIDASMGVVINTISQFLDTVKSPCWPEYSCVYRQLGTTTKELYVDDVTDVDWGKSHNWLKADLESFAGGAPINVLCSFLRRRVLESGEEAPKKPGNAYKWEQEPKGGGEVVA